MVIRLNIEGTLPDGVGKARYAAQASTPGGPGVMKVTSVLNLVDLAVG